MPEPPGPESLRPLRAPLILRAVFSQPSPALTVAPGVVGCLTRSAREKAAGRVNRR